MSEYCSKQFLGTCEYIKRLVAENKKLQEKYDIDIGRPIEILVKEIVESRLSAIRKLWRDSEVSGFFLPSWMSRRLGVLLKQKGSDKK